MHSPTKNVLEIYNALIESGLLPLIIDANSMPHHPKLPLYDHPFSANNNSDIATGLNKINTPNYNNISIFKVDNDLSLINNSILLHDLFTKIQPQFSIVVGSHNIIAEHFAKYIPTATLMTGKIIMPFRNSENIYLTNKLSNYQTSMLAEYNIEANKFKMLPITAVKDIVSPNKSLGEKISIGIRNENFAIAIGSNRLATDINEAEFILFENLLALSERTIIGLFGNCPSELAKYINDRFHQRVILFGHQDNISSFISCFDVYLNTKRQGGGHTANISLAVGILTLSINYGDVSTFLSKKYLAESYFDLVELVRARLNHNRVDSKLEAEAIYNEFWGFKDIVNFMLIGLEKATK
jgi:hypothetical protein